MDPDEARDFVGVHHRAVLATTRSDGRPQLSPVLCAVDDEGRVVVSTRETAMKTANLRRDPHATMCVDVDPRIDDPTKPPRAVVGFGLAELVENEAIVREITAKMELRYLGAVPPEFEEALWFEGRTSVVITPTRWLAWDQGKTG